MDQLASNRRSAWNSLRVEEEFTTRQIQRVITFAGLYMGLATLVVCAFYLYVLHPAPIGRSSPFALFGDLASRWHEAPELRGAVGIWLLGMVGMSGLFAIATGVVFSRRLAGPLHRIKSDLARIEAGGALRPIALREGDELQELADLLNAALVSIEQRSLAAGSRMRRDADGAGVEESVVAMRSHLARLEAMTLPGTSGAAVESWIVGMRDLLDKADHSGAL